MNNITSKSLTDQKTLTRRLFLGRAALAPAAAAAAIVPVGNICAAEAAERPAPHSMWNKYMSAKELLQHPLLSASLVLDEMCTGADSRWWVTMCGRDGTWQPSFSVHRFDEINDPESPRLRIERETLVMHVANGRLQIG